VIEKALSVDAAVGTGGRHLHQGEQLTQLVVGNRLWRPVIECSGVVEQAVESVKIQRVHQCGPSWMQQESVPPRE
jgi:hypothetical protein